MLGLGGAFAVLASVMCAPPSIGRPRLLVLPGVRATTCLTVVLLVCLETVLLSTVSNCAKTFYMHWNTTNSIFRIDNTDHIIDVNKGNLAFEYDQVHIICPVYEPGTFDNETEKYIIYNVSKVEYETCRITNANPRIIAICDKPQKMMFFTITFRPFTPQPGGLEFLPGNDYYFISTSSKDDLHRRIGGRCSTNNMKVVFKVCCAAAGSSNNNNNDDQSLPPASHVPSTAVASVPAAGHGSSSSSSSSASGAPGATSSGHGSTGVSINTNIEQQRNNGRPVVPPSTISWPRGNSNPQSTVATTSSGYPPHQYYPPSNQGTSVRPNSGTNHQNNNSNYAPSHKPTKKSNEYDKHPNEVVKNEELTYNSSATRPSHSVGALAAFLLLGPCVVTGLLNALATWLRPSGRPSTTPRYRVHRTSAAADDDASAREECFSDRHMTTTTRRWHHSCCQR